MMGTHIDNMPAIPRPVMLISHQRACSTAFERMFIQNRYTITYHEPFGDAYFVGPERRFSRYEADRSASGFSDVTYKSAMDDIEAMCQLAAGQEKRLFIKDMAYFLVPSPGEKCGLACSFVNFPPEDQNPTLLPKQELEKFHFTFLIRHPRLSFASYYRLSSPAHKDKSKVSKFNPTDVGYTQLRCLFDYLKSEKLIGSHDPLQNGAKSKEPPVQICLVDAEDLLRQPEAIMKAYCKSTGISYDASMRQWGDLQDQEKAAKIINRWGFEAYFHRQVLDSTSLGLQVAQEHDSEDDYQKWTVQYGTEGAEEIQKAVDDYLPDYNYLKQFALKI